MVKISYKSYKNTKNTRKKYEKYDLGTKNTKKYYLGISIWYLGNILPPNDNRFDNFLFWQTSQGVTYELILSTLDADPESPAEGAHGAALRLS